MVKRETVSKKNVIENCLFTTGESFEKKPDFLFRKSGCAALDLAYVAAGRYDGYFQHNLNIWDIAAGIILIKEAGGVINKIDLDNNQNIKVIASSADISQKLQQILDKF